MRLKYGCRSTALMQRFRLIDKAKFQRTTTPYSYIVYVRVLYQFTNPNFGVSTTLYDDTIRLPFQSSFLHLTPLCFWKACFLIRSRSCLRAISNKYQESTYPILSSTQFPYLRFAYHPENLNCFHMQRGRCPKLLVRSAMAQPMAAAHTAMLVKALRRTISSR